MGSCDAGLHTFQRYSGDPARMIMGQRTDEASLAAVLDLGVINLGFNT